MIESQSNRALAFGLLFVMVLLALMVLMISAPAGTLLGESAYGVRSAFHGLVAGVLMVAMTIGFFQAFRLLTSENINADDLMIGGLFNAVVCFLAIAGGNWLYIPYRAPGGARAHFLATTPAIHKIFFEFKEFTALLAFPFAVGAAYLICRHGRRINSDRLLRESIALLLILAFFYFAVAFGLGASVTKLKSV